MPHQLATALASISLALWRCYTHPASAALSVGNNGEGRRRQQTRDSFNTVVDRIQKPNLPLPDGSIVSCYDPLEEYAHQVGRLLRRIDTASISKQIISEINREIVAVESAELGDFSDRAAQATLLTHQDVAPAQLAAALEAFTEDPLEPSEIFTAYDPTAACAAAATFLQAASLVAAEAVGRHPRDVILEADHIQALPHQTPSKVLELIFEGYSPSNVVVSLIAETMGYAHGKFTNPVSTIEVIQDTLDRTDPTTNGKTFLETVQPIQFTSIDLTHPAPDMLEDLIKGIYGCWLLWDENNFVDTDHPTDDEFEKLQEDTSQIDRNMRRQFSDAVRSKAISLPS